MHKCSFYKKNIFLNCNQVVAFCNETPLLCSDCGMLCCVNNDTCTTNTKWYSLPQTRWTITAWLNNNNNNNTTRSQIKAKWIHLHADTLRMFCSLRVMRGSSTLWHFQKKNDTFTFISKLNCCKAWDGLIIWVLYENVGSKIRYSLFENDDTTDKTNE